MFNFARRYIRENIPSLVVLAALILPAAVLPFAAFGCAGPSLAATTELNVSAAASLTDALTEVNAVYAQVRPNVTIAPNFAASGTLQRQIENGAPADVFISAGSAQMDSLQSGQLIVNDTRRDLLANKVVLIVPVDSTLGLTDLAGLASDRVKRVAVGDPRFVPAGAYALQALDELGITARVRPKMVVSGDVRQVLTYVESGNVDAGIVYSTDAKTSARVKVVATAPDGINTRVVYPVAIIKASRHADAAADYESFLFSARAKAIFEKYGFTVVGK